MDRKTNGFFLKEKKAQISCIKGAVMALDESVKPKLNSAEENMPGRTSLCWKHNGFDDLISLIHSA